MVRITFQFVPYLSLVALAVSGYSNASTTQLPNIHWQRKNVILGWTDGMGSNVLPLLRQYKQALQNPHKLTYDGYETPLEGDLIGKSRTGSSSHLITDSAAGATAVATGLKTYNGAIGVDPDAKAKATILEAAKAAGYLTGVITTSYTWDASPASFNAHSTNRDYAGFIAGQQVGIDHPLGFTTDLLLGGGLCAYLPESNPDSCRTDSHNLLEEVKTKTNYTIVLNSSELSASNSLPLLGLFAPKDLAYPIDRPKNGSQPGLLDMVDKALDLLYAATEHSEKGFFLFYESQVTDSAQHRNDLIGTLSGATEISETAIKVKEWVRKLDMRGDDTLFFSTSDHETGGFALGSGQPSPVDAPWGWNPFVIANATHSAVHTAKLIAVTDGSASQVRAVINNNLNLVGLLDSEVQEVIDARGSVTAIRSVLVTLINRRARIGFTTKGHTSADVDIYCFWEYQDYCLAFRGSSENTELAGKMERFLGVDMNAVTKKISHFNTSPPELTD